MSDIYLSLTETPTVVTLSQPVVSGVLTSNVTVTNVVSVNVVTMPAINVTAAAPAVTTVAGTVSISNFPSTQTIAGTVTANAGGDFGGAIEIVNDVSNVSHKIAVQLYDDNGSAIGVSNNPLPVSGTVTVGNSVTIGSLPAISGTVTANLVGKNYNTPNPKTDIVTDSSGRVIVDMVPNFGFSGVAEFGSEGIAYVKTKMVSGSVTIGSVPNGSLTTRFGTPTTASVAFATSCVTNANRKYLLIQNVTTGSNVITVGIGFTPTTTQGIQLTAGAGITFESSYIPTGAVYVLSSVTASNFTILEA